MPKARAVFLDRDGTLMVDVGYPRLPELVWLLPGVAEALTRLKQQGFFLIVVSNQSGIGRGLVTATEAEQVHQRFVAVLAEAGAQLDEAYYCPHGPDEGCICRKPSPEFLLRAAAKFDLDLARSFMVGDKITDAEAGRRAGCRAILLRPGALDAEFAAVADFVVGDWKEVLATILSPNGTDA